MQVKKHLPYRNALQHAALEDVVAHKGQTISGVIEGRGIWRVSWRVNGRQHRRRMASHGEHRAILEIVGITHNDVLAAIGRQVQPRVLEIRRLVLISDRTGRGKADMRPFGSTGLYVPNYRENEFGTHFWPLWECCHVAPTSAPVAGSWPGWARGRTGRKRPRQGPTWGSRGMEKGDTPSRCRTVRNDEGVSLITTLK